MKWFAAATGLVAASGIVVVLRQRLIANRRKNKVVRDTGEGLDPEKCCKQGFHPKLVPKDIDIIIIGSGMGGLATASLMAQEGKTVLVLEQHDQAGGNLHTFEEGGWEFDTGLHYIGGMGSKKGTSRKLVDYISDHGVEWKQMADVYDKVVFRTEETSRKMTASIRNEFGMSSKGGVKGMIADVKKRFPGEEDAVDAYFAMVREAAGNVPVLFIRNMMPNWMSWLLSPLFDSLLALYYRTTGEVLSSLTSNRQLIGVLSYMFGDYGEPPSSSSFGIQAMLQTHYCAKGSFYPEGGPAKLSRAIVRVIERSGGKVLVRAAVDRIDVDAWGHVMGVTLKSGDQIAARTVVSTVGAPKTFQSFIAEEQQWRVRAEVAGIKKLQAEGSGVSLATMFVGLSSDTGPMPLPACNTWVFPSYDHDETVAKMRQDPYARPILFISFSSAKDPTYKARHKGKQCCLVCAPCLFGHVEEHADKRVKRRGKEYEAYKEKLKAAMLEGLLREYPDLEGSIEFADLGTACTNDYYLGTVRGAVYGRE